jgi:hypothetical protein
MSNTTLIKKVSPLEAEALSPNDINSVDVQKKMVLVKFDKYITLKLRGQPSKFWNLRLLLYHFLTLRRLKL